MIFVDLAHQPSSVVVDFLLGDGKRNYQGTGERGQILDAYKLVEIKSGNNLRIARDQRFISRRRYDSDRYFVVP